MTIALPIGISFYTFQTLAYTIDVYRGRITACKQFFSLASFISFFPLLLSGPIERAERIIPQLEKIKTGAAKTEFRQYIVAIQLFAWGLFKKIVIADNLAYIADFVFIQSNGIQDTGLALLGMYAFTIQIYCDFSGYTDMARGVAKCFGIDLMVNFNLPYFSKSMQDFWRRWHISLSTWLRDYLYIPLGGNRGSSFRTALNIIITMLLGGIWHGSTWMFVLWGIYHGLLLIIERFIDKRITSTILHKYIKMFLIFNLIAFGWVLFKSPDGKCFTNWVTMLVSFNFKEKYFSAWLPLLFYSSPLICVWIIQYRNSDENSNSPILPLSLKKQYFFTIIIYFGLMLFSADSVREFIYFKF